MTKMTPEEIKTRNALLQGIVDRCDVQGLRGQKRDAAALDIACGICHALIVTGHPLAQNMLGITAMILTTRGAYGEAKRIANEKEDAE